MRKFLAGVLALVLLAGPGAWAQQTTPAAGNDAAELRQEIETLKKTIADLEARVAAQEKQKQQAAQPQPAEGTVSATDLKTQVSDLDDRVNSAEKKSALDRLNWSGDYRFEAHTIWGTVPAHYDGMQLQNLVVKTMWFAGMNGYTPAQMAGLLSSPLLPNGQPNTPANFASLVNGAVANNYGSYQYFANNLKFNSVDPSNPGLKQMMSAFSPQMQQAMMAYMMQAPGVFVNKYTANNDVLYTNRLRLRFTAKVADNVSVDARLSMYKVFGDSSGVQVFNGQPNTLSIDGTTTRVPSGDMLRVERAFFNWTNIGGSKLYFSIGRRPSSDGPPLNLRQDEPRGGTPAASLFDYQYDGMTLGYHLTEKTTLRACYGVGYSAGFGNGDLLKTPADRLKDVHLMGVMSDLYDSEKTFVQVLLAHAWNVTDGFNGQVVLPNNPLTGDVIPAPMIMRFTPSANLGGINLYGIVAQHRLGPVDMFVSGNWSSLRPNGVTTPFGGLGSDPFDVPQNREGHMVYAGLRFNVPQNDGRTKLGFEFNQGSRYWFNFANAEDDIIAPKTQTRGEAYETYLTHRINEHFIFKAGFIHYNYTWSGSGWHLGAPKRLDSTPLLGFPTYDVANMFTIGMTARF